jgi:hypothetical protein
MQRRYVPRIESGRDLYVLKMRNYIEEGKWADILALFVKQSMAQVRGNPHVFFFVGAQDAYAFSRLLPTL